MAQNTHDMITEEREDALPDRAMTRQYREYVEGDHAATLTIEQSRMLGPDSSNPLADNVLKMVLNASAARLELTGYECEDQVVLDFLTFDLFTKNNFGKIVFDANFAMLRDGDHFLGLDWLPESSRPIVKQIKVWDGIDGMFVAYDGYGLPSYACREWHEVIDGKERVRRTIYYPDRIERWIQEGKGWKPYRNGGDPEGTNGIIKWTKTDGSPLGIPVVHLANGSYKDSHYGVSDIKGMLALQDDINSIQNDISAASKFTGFKMYWGTGISTEETFRVGPGMMVKANDPAAKFGEFDPGEITQLISAHDHKRQTIAVNTQTPIHVITGANWPSGMALLQADMPLISKAERLAKITGPQWTTLAHRATEMANAFGGMGLNEDAPITSVFADPMKLDDQAILEIQQAKVKLYTDLLAMNDPVLMAKTGLLTDEEITKILARKEDAAERAAQQMAASTGFV